MFFQQFNTPGLGCFSYIIGCPVAGVMAVVDPRRDVDDYLRVSKSEGMRVTHIFDTHVHADHVSGAPELRAATGADIYIHESAPVAYPAIKVKGNDTFALGNAHIQVLHTPGHTPNSISLLVTDLSRSEEPEMILTGDLLFVGDVGRPDLPGAELLEGQVKNLYDSLHVTLGGLPDYLEVYPAHGQGSLCGRGMSAKPSSTLGYERLANPMLRFGSFNEFKNAILANLPMRPQSFSAIIATNMRGAALLEAGGSWENEHSCGGGGEHTQSNKKRGEHALSDNKCNWDALPNLECSGGALNVGEFDRRRMAGAAVLDLRDAELFGEAHIPGSVNVDFSGGPMLNWVGMAVPPGVELALVLPGDGDFGVIKTELGRIGYDSVAGWLVGGIEAWKGSGKETSCLPRIAAADLRARLREPNNLTLADVRSPEEFMNDKIEGSCNLTFDKIVQGGAYPFAIDAEIIVVCQSGFRAGIAAGMLMAQGYRHVCLLDGGMEAWNG